MFSKKAICPLFFIAIFINFVSIMKIVLVGAGNLATCLGRALMTAQHEILQVYSRTIASAEALADIVNGQAVNDLSLLTDAAELYILSLKDNVLEEIIPQVCQGRGAKVFIHTAGSMPLSCFKGFAQHYGVFYPMQTFSKSRTVDFHEIPVFLESNDEETRSIMASFARSLSDRVYYLETEKRKYLHLSAVWACNFVNHCYMMASDILQNHDIPFSVMLPLIDETARKVHSVAPRTAQTGPAIRYDENVINKQLELMSEDELGKRLYQLMSESIHERFGSDK